MKRVLLILTLMFVVVAFFPQDAQAIPLGPSLRFYPCINAKGTYTLRVKVVDNLGGIDGVGGAENFFPIGFNLIGRKNGGEWKNYGEVYIGWLGTFWGNPEGTTFDFYFDFLGGPVGSSLGINGFGYYSIKLQGTEYPRCEVCKGKPLFKMYLLTRPDSYCLIISEYHPSVERQKALCFPGTDWVATNTPCAGYVCDEDCWQCDYLGFERLRLKDLRSIYERHLARTQ